MRPLRLPIALVLLVLLAVLAPPAHAADLFRGSLRYDRPSCGDVVRTTVVGRPSLRLVRKNGSGRNSEALAKDGSYAIRVPGSGPVKATALVRGSRFAVHRRKGGGFYEFALGSQRPGQFAAFVVAARDPDAGALNIFEVLTQGVRDADHLLPTALSRFKVYWNAAQDLAERADLKGSKYAPGEAAIYVDAEGKREEGDEFEPYVLMHELGHHVLFSRKFRPRVWVGWEHTATQVFLDDSLPWSEGFADFFAAFTLFDPSPRWQCARRFDIGARPPVPAPVGPDAENHRQWNETAVSGALWQLAAYHGNGSRTLGARRIVRALDRWTIGIDSFKEARDAMIAGGLEDDTTKHREVTGLLSEDGISWGLQLDAIRDDPSDRPYSSAHQSTHIAVRAGPWKDCASKYEGNDAKSPAGEFAPGFPAQWTGTIGPLGGMPFTWQDDCLITGDDPNANQEEDLAGARLWLTYPYMDDQSHVGARMGVVLTFTCVESTGDDPDPCPATGRYRLSYTHGQASHDAVHVELPANTPTLIMRITPEGECEWAAPVQPAPSCRF